MTRFLIWVKLDDKYDLNLALTNKSNNFEQELSAMVTPFFCKPVRVGGGYTFWL